MTLARAISVRISVLVHATEEQAKLTDLIGNVCPEGLPRKLETNSFKGHYGNQITRIQIRTNGSSRADQFLAKLWAGLPQVDRSEIFSSVENHLDSSGTLHLRLDKQECSLGRMVLGNSDPVKIEVQFALRGQSGESITEGVRKKLDNLQYSELRVR